MASVIVKAGDHVIEIPMPDGFTSAEALQVALSAFPVVCDMHNGSVKAESDKAKTRERVAAHRQKKKAEDSVTVTECNAPVTECNVTSSPYNPLNNNNNNNSLDNKHTLRVTANEDSYGNPLPEQDWADIHQSYFTEFGVLMPQGVREDDVYQAYKTLGKDIVVLAIQHTARNAGDSAGRHAYLMAVLRAWISSGVKTVAEANAQIERHQRETRQKNGADDRMRIKTNEDYYVPGAPDGFGWGDLLDVKT